MERTRFIAAAPIRSASAAWDLICQLITSTLEKSSAIPVESVTKELSGIRGIGIALVAAGHLEVDGLRLTAENLDVSICVRTADAALGIDENLNPVPGGGSAGQEWMLYLPEKNALSVMLQAAINSSAHLALGKPKSEKPQTTIKTASESVLDYEAIKRLAGGGL